MAKDFSWIFRSRDLSDLLQSSLEDFSSQRARHHPPTSAISCTGSPIGVESVMLRQ